jgi:acetyltransferase-like isoleucine patch superfamily enzyme
MSQQHVPAPLEIPCPPQRATVARTARRHLKVAETLSLAGADLTALQQPIALPQPEAPVVREQALAPSRASVREWLKLHVAPAVSRCWVAWYRLRLGRRVEFGCNFLTNGRLVVRGPGRVIFGDDVNAWCHAEKNVFITYTPEARIEVGNGCRINGAGMMARSGIRIGPRCILGSTLIVDNDFHPVDPELRHDPRAPICSRAVRVGANVWLGGQSALLKGVTVGDNSMVAFRAVVANAVPANVVVAGNPARVVKRLVEREFTG